MIKQWHLTRRFCVFLVALAIPQSGNAQAQSMAFVMEHFPPFIQDDNGNGVGPFPEVVRAVCDSMKVKCTLKVLPWRRAYAMAVSGVVDGIFVLARTPEREHAFYFSDLVFQSSFAVFVRHPTFNYAQPQDLKGFTVATYGPSAVSREIQELAKTVPMHLEMEIDNQAVLRKLRAGRYPEPSAGVMNRDVGVYIIAQEKLSGLRIAGEFKPIAYGIGLSKNRVTEEQADRFNETLRMLLKQGTVKTIADKYGLIAVP
jgi:polar amino acid transport system substrate-binding protein